MHTFQIAQKVLEDYRAAKLPDERIDFLINQANEQLDEISQNEEIYNKFLDEVEAPQPINNIILWILFMSNDDICSDYKYKFKKGFTTRLPISDIADLLVHIIHMTKSQDAKLDGFDYLMGYKEDGLEEADQYAFANVLLFVQKSKEAQMEF